MFLKGCPLACAWCHNPEGMSPVPQILKGAAGDRVAGTKYTSTELAKLLNSQAAILKANEGGVTFSGGEPLMQADFVSEVIDQLQGIHVVLDTSGFAPEADFRKVAGKSDLIFLDLKVIDREGHRKYTGHYNDVILRNLSALQEMGKPFHVRVPLVPGVTDTPENLSGIAAAVKGMSNLVQVDLLPYNRAAGGKYEACGMKFEPIYDESRELQIDLTPFLTYGLEVRVA